MAAKKVSLRSSVTTTRSTVAPSPTIAFFIRSWVMGRGGETFSISSAMALASKTPTQIGSTESLSTSLRTMIGMLVVGSSISPLNSHFDFHANLPGTAVR